MVQFDAQFLDTLKKYDCAAPRYTSYPPVPVFSERFTSNDYLEQIVQTHRKGGEEISLYFHFPFCKSLCYFCGCNVIATNNHARIAEYLEYLKKEIKLYGQFLPGDTRVAQMHFGGGSPSYLTPAEFSMIANANHKQSTFTDDAELSIEIDPRGVTEEHIKTYAEAGINRFSLGVQDFNSTVQELINRVQTFGQTREVIEWAKKAGIDNFNLDLIYGLPSQTLESFDTTLDQVLELSPDRLAVYSFAYIPKLRPAQTLIPIELLPNPTAKLELLMLAAEKLTNAGYVHIGMDHFAKPNDPLALAMQNGSLHRNFQGYSTKKGLDLFGLGLSAIGRVENCYAQNQKTLPEYYRLLDQDELPTQAGYRMTFDDQIREFVIMSIMCDGQVQADAVEEIFGIDFESYFSPELENLLELEEDDLIIISDRSITVSERGKYFLRNIAMHFDAYIKPLSSKAHYSRTI